MIFLGTAYGYILGSGMRLIVPILLNHLTIDNEINGAVKNGKLRSNLLKIY